jgi:hypothetical protein
MAEPGRIGQNKFIRQSHMIMLFRALFVLLAAFGSLRAAPLQIVSEAYGSGSAYVTCVIDGRKERLFLDTGSAMTILTNSSRIAGYTNLGIFHFKSAANVAQEVETIQIGSIELDGVVFPRVKVGRASFSRAENALGIDLLRGQPFAVRFTPKPSLDLNPSAPRQTFNNLEISSQGLLAIPVSLGPSDVLALWDTGVSITSIDKEFIAAHPENFKATNKGGTGFDGAGKPLLLQVYRARKIVVAGHAFEDVRVVAADLSLLRENWSKDIQAVVGFNLIRKGNWHFDASNRRWAFER